MAKTFSLAIYSITLDNREDNSEQAVLSDFSEGNDFLDFINNIINGLKRIDDGKSTEDPIGKKADVAYRLARVDSDNYRLVRAGRYLHGVIESGSFGTEEEGVDIDSGKKSFRKAKSDALMRPFFFEFYIPTDSKYGFLIIEKIGNNGILTVLSSMIESKFNESGHHNLFTLNIKPISLNTLVDKKMKALKYEAKKIEFTKVSKNDLKLSKISNHTVDDKNIIMSIVYSAPANGVMKLVDFIKTLKQQREDTLYRIDNDLTCEDIKVQVKIEGKDKTLSLLDYRSLGTSMDMSTEVELQENGYPSYESVKKQADILVSYIIDEYFKKQS